MNISKSIHHRLATKNSFTPLTEEKVTQIQRCIIGSYFLGTRYFVPKQKCLIIERNRVFQRIYFLDFDSHFQINFIIL